MPSIGTEYSCDYAKAMGPPASSSNGSAPKDDGPFLTLEMYAASKRLHTITTSMVNLKLLVLLSDTILYARAISCFYPVFKALEEALHKAKPAELRTVKMLTPVLARTAAIETDLQHYFGYV